MKGKRIFIAVTNDLVADQRVHRTASSLTRNHAEVLVIGRKLPNSLAVPMRPYRIRRMRLLFQRGPFFYACYNVRLFFLLLLHRMDLLVANDLDTLPACFIASRIKGVPLVYDSHEYFTEVPELIGRRFPRNIWLSFEKRILPRIRYASAVSHSVAEAYHERYGIRMEVIRNLPVRTIRKSAGADLQPPDLQPPDLRRVIIYQGALNVGRGLELMISAMQHLEAYLFQVFGDGDIAGRLRVLAGDLNVGDRVAFMGRMPFEELKSYTRRASLGVSLEEDRGLNYRFALPNKLFDYIQAGIPVLVSDLPEMRGIVTSYEIGEVLRNPVPEALARQIREMMESHELRRVWKKNLRKAAGDLCWENEEEKLLALCARALAD